MPRYNYVNEKRIKSGMSARDILIYVVDRLDFNKYYRNDKSADTDTAGPNAFVEKWYKPIAIYPRFVVFEDEKGFKETFSALETMYMIKGLMTGEKIKERQKKK